MSDLNNNNEEVLKEYETIDPDPVYTGEEIQATTAMNNFQRVINIIVSPSKALQAIKDKPNFILPILIVILVPALYYLLFWSDFEMQTIKQMEVQFEASGVEMTEEYLRLPLLFLKIFTPIGLVLGTIIGGLISSLYYFICSKVAKSEVEFKQIASMIYHVMVISTFSTILLVILSLLNIESELTVPMTSLASLFPGSMRTSVLFGFALPIEVFSIWGTCVTYFGLRIVANMSKKAALISVLLAFLAGVLITGGSMWLQTIINSMNSIG